MSLTIVLATRGRPALVCATLERTLPNIRRQDTRLVVCVDDDDPKTEDALHATDLSMHPSVLISSLQREDDIGSKWNRGYRYYPADLYMIMSDYTSVITPGFDQRMLDAADRFPDGIGVVMGHMANASFSGAYGYTHKLCDKLGWMYPPYFPFWFVDHWLDDIARLIDRVSFADVTLIWPSLKTPTQNFREVSWWATFFDAMRLMRRRQARAIIDGEDFIEPEWRKEILRRHYPLTEFRSQGINDLVRSWNAADPVTLADERYLRVKAQAQRMMAEEWPPLKQELEAA